MEHHLSIFRPYERDAKHEDQLTRAALIVLKLVPLAHEAFLRLAGCQPLSSLPVAAFAMQTGKLAAVAVDNEDCEVDELVSIFLAPHDNIEAPQPNLASERKARYDGVIQYGARLVVVIESKLYADASEQQSLDINPGGLAAKYARMTAIRWQDLLDHWWNLLEGGLLGPAESGVMSDFFDNAEHNFADLLPYTDLERCGEHPGRQLRRLRAILEEATGLSAEVRDTLGHAGVKFEQGSVVAFDRASLYIDGGEVLVSVWPAELGPQYKRVYSDPQRAEALLALTDAPEWNVYPNFHLSFWRASVPRRWYPARHLAGATYVRQWIDDVHDQRAGRRPRDELAAPAFRTWLVERGYATESELSGLDEWAATVPMDKFDVRPSMQVTRSWQLSDAVARDRAGLFVGDVRAAIDDVLAALDEPSLEALHKK